MNRKTPMARGTSRLARTPFKKKPPKKRAGHDQSMLDACRGQPCYLNVVGVCQYRDETVVPCHANWSEYGKGMGLKAKDEFTVPGCADCHRWLDQGSADKETKRAIWHIAFDRWRAVRDGETT